MSSTYVRYVTELEATPEEIWPCLVEPELQKRWMVGLEESSPIRGTGTRPGDQFRMQIREGGKLRSYVAELLAYERPYRLSVRMWPEDDPENFNVTVTYELSHVPGGSTLSYTCDLELERPGCLMRLMAPIGHVMSRLLIRRFMRNLNRLIQERRQTAA